MTNTTQPDAEEGPQVRPFSEWLIQQARGRAHDDLSKGMHQLIAAVQETGKGGKLVLTVDVKPLKGNTDALEVSAKVTAKAPEYDPPASIFFVDDAGNLTRNDPRQMSLPLRDVADRRDESASSRGA